MPSASSSESAVGGVRLTAGTACPLNVFGWDRKSTQHEPDTRQTALPRTAFPLTLMLQACNAAASAPFLRQTGTMMNTVP